MSTLNGAFALAQMNRAAFAIAENLDLDMMGLKNQFFHVHRTVAEGADRLARRAIKGARNLAFGIDPAHALAPAAGGRFQKDGIADLLRENGGLSRVSNDARASRNPWHL